MELEHGYLVSMLRIYELMVWILKSYDYTLIRIQYKKVIWEINEIVLGDFQIKETREVTRKELYCNIVTMNFECFAHPADL